MKQNYREGKLKRKNKNYRQPFYQNICDNYIIFLLNMQQRRIEMYYELTTQMIGQGVFAQVFLAKRRTTGELVAVKKLTRNNDLSLREKDILFTLMKYQNPYVVLIHDIFEQGQSIFIVQEYCIGGSLYDQMVLGPLAEEQTMLIMEHIFEGLKFLHEIGIIHRDIKPENILKQKTHDGKDIYKITDFGLSNLNMEQITNAKIGTAYYVPPEVVEGQKYDKSIDIWAAGLVLDELIHQTPFYNGSTEEEILLKIKNLPYSIRSKDYKDAAYLFEPKKFLIQQILLNTIVRDATKRKDPTWIIEQIREYKKIQSNKTNRQLFSEEFDFMNEQKFQNLQNLDVPNTYNKWNNDQQSKQSVCQQHALPMKFRFPSDEKKFIPGCQKCLQLIYVYEVEYLNKSINDATFIMQSKGFNYFYRPDEIEQKIKGLIEKTQVQDFEIRESEYLLQQYNLICNKWENTARNLFISFGQQLTTFRDKGYVGGDEGMLVKCLLSQLNEENKMLGAFREKMNEFKEQAFLECKALLQEQLIQMAENLIKKIDKL